MTYDILRDFSNAFRRRKEGKISVEKLVAEIEKRIQDDDIYALPIMDEHLNTYQDDKLCRLIYQYMVVRSFSYRSQMGVSVKVLAQICGRSYIETYAAVRKIEIYGAIEQELVSNSERKKVETDRYRLSHDLSYLWESFLPWNSFRDKDKGKLAEQMEYMIYRMWRNNQTKC